MISEKKIATQARVASQIISRCIGETLILRHAADRCLLKCYRENRQLGSRDRRIINQAFYAILRWWGALLPVLPPKFIRCWQNQGAEIPPTADIDWYCALANAMQMDGANKNTPDIIDFWKSHAPHWRTVTAVERESLVPDWLHARLSRQLDKSCAELIDWQQRRPPVWLRAQTDNLNLLMENLAADGIPTTAHPRLPMALKIQSDGNFNLRNQKNFKSGEYEIQDLGSQCIGLVCEAKPGEQWWDACAGAGGKTLHLAWEMNRRGSVVASDIRTYKLDELKLRARRAQFPNIRIKEWKGGPMPNFKGRFDGVLVDAPCSCSGTWRRNPAGRWTLTETEIAECAKLQAKLLQNAATAVKPGGALIYATCSMFEEENNAIINGFLTNNPDFQLEKFVNPLTGEMTNGQCQIWPWHGDCDAMFVAKCRRADKTATGHLAQNNKP